MSDYTFNPLAIFEPGGPINHTAITTILERTLEVSRPTQGATARPTSEADHRTTTMLALAALEPATTFEASYASQIVVAGACAQRLLTAASRCDDAQSEMRRLAATALGLLRFTQTATRRLEQRQAARRESDGEIAAVVQHWCDRAAELRQELEGQKRLVAELLRRQGDAAGGMQVEAGAGGAREGKTDSGTEDPLHREDAAGAAGPAPAVLPGQGAADPAERQRPASGATLPNGVAASRGSGREERLVLPAVPDGSLADPWRPGLRHAQHRPAPGREAAPRQAAG